MKSSRIRTYSGRWFDPFNPDPDEIAAIDVAYALSRIPRYTGHTRGEPYSVAQHSSLAYDLVSPALKLTALLHDASEFVLADLAKPIKMQAQLGSYRLIENNLMYAIARKFGIIYPLPPQVKEIDDTLLYTEMRDLLDMPSNGHEVLPIRIEPVSWKTALLEFTHRLTESGIEMEETIVI